MARHKSNHYDTLGVDKKATAAEIKRAYRKKAEKAHPDKGGDHDEMAAINAAWECLSNPSLRLLYDETGQDSRKPIEQEIMNVLMEAFTDALQRDAAHCLNHARKFLQSRLDQLKLQMSSAKDAKKKLTAKREKVSVTQGDNLFHLLIDQQLGRIDQGIAQIEHGKKILNAALKQLDSYESNEEEAVIQTLTFSIGAIRFS